GVVGDVRRHAIALAHDLAEGQVAPIEVDGLADRPGPAVDETRRPDPDPEQRGGAAVEELVEKLEDELDGGVAVASVDRQLHASADLAAEVDQAAGEMLLAEVESDDQTGVVLDLDEDGGLAAAGWAAADLAHDAVVEEDGNDVGDSGTGEAGESGHLGATDRPEVVQGANDESLVVAAGLSVRGLCRQRHTAVRASSGPAPSAELRPVDGQSAGWVGALSSRWTKTAAARASPRARQAAKEIALRRARNSVPPSYARSPR